MKSLLICALLTVAVLTGCDVTKNGTPETVELIDGSQVNLTAAGNQVLYVNDHLVDCVGVGPQKCMLTRSDQTQDWEFDYDGIIGFDFESGYSYVLEISVKTIDNPPADGSNIERTLVRVIQKVETDG